MSFYVILYISAHHFPLDTMLEDKPQKHSVICVNAVLYVDGLALNGGDVSAVVMMLMFAE